MPRERLDTREAVDRFLRESPELEGDGALAFGGDEKDLGFDVLNAGIRLAFTSGAEAKPAAGPTRSEARHFRSPAGFAA